jgi:hypothetical protein
MALIRCRPVQIRCGVARGEESGLYHSDCRPCASAWVWPRYSGHRCLPHERLSQ